MKFDPEIIRYTALAVLAAGAILGVGYWAGKRAASPAPVTEPNPRPPRRRRPVVRALLFSLLVHAGLVLAFSVYIVSEAVYQAVRIPERQEVTLQADALARERLALEIREASPTLPPLPAPEAMPADSGEIERLPLPELPVPHEPGPVAAPLAAWERMEPPEPAAGERFRPARLMPDAMAAASPALPELRLDEPEPIAAPDQLPDAGEITSPDHQAAPAWVETPEPVAPQPLAAMSPPPAELVPAALEVQAPSPARLEFDLPPLPIPADLAQPALALEARTEPADRFLLRDRKKREQALADLGGSPETEAAIERALRWLARHQEPDGRWKIDRFGGKAGHDVAATSLAALAFLGWGADPSGGDNFGKAAGRALDWLIERTNEEGDLRHEEGRPSGDMYDQGMAGIALAEAYAITGDPRFREAASRAIGFIVAAQNPGDGGWRYRPGEGGDTSVFGWQIMALTSAQSAGLEVPEEAFERARRWLVQVGGGQHGGEYGYQSRSPSPAMVAEGMYSRQLIGRGPGADTAGRDDPAMLESAAYLARHLPRENQRDYYYWYYGALALYQHQGPVWEEWNSLLRPILLESQRRGGADDGSWDTNSRWGPQSGRVVVTALAALTLEVYYRYLPLYDGAMK